MAPKLTCMAEGVVFRLAAHDRGGLCKALKGSLARVAKPPMPGGRRSGHKGAGTGG